MECMGDEMVNEVFFVVDCDLEVLVVVVWEVFNYMLWCIYCFFVVDWFVVVYYVSGVNFVFGFNFNDYSLVFFI